MEDVQKEIKEIASSLRGHLIYQRDILLSEGISADEHAKIQAAVRKELENRIKSRQAKNGEEPHSPIVLPVPVGHGQSQFSEAKDAEKGHADDKACSPMPRADHQPSTTKPSSNVKHKELLEELRAQIGDCQGCRLGKTRTNLVFGVGNPDARLIFVGEGPGRDEDIQGEPFVGRAGQLLTDIITKGMKMRREDVYICNVVKCRPPENRNPEPDEIEACEGFLKRQLEIIKPEIIVALGTFAAKTLLKTDLVISKLRGRFHDYNGIKVMPTYHPSYLLRNPEAKKDVWEDIKMVMKELN